MALQFEDLRVLEAAEAIADDVWRQVVRWDPFARQVVGGQLARAADSVGANIAEAFGRYHYGEKLKFLYYSRGSLFEAKYWLNRARTRDLMSSAQVQDYGSQLSDLARQLNAFAASLKAQRRATDNSHKRCAKRLPITLPMNQSRYTHPSLQKTISVGSRRSQIPNTQYAIPTTGGFDGTRTIYQDDG